MKLTNGEYSAAVARGQFPVDPLVMRGDEFCDDRGSITNLLLSGVSSVARISSLQGAVRANHYHLTDWHYAIVEQGRVLYFDRPVGEKSIGQPRVFVSGEIFFTPPMREHAMLFAVDTVIYTLAKNIRNHENHESDLVRVEYITPEIAADYLRRYVF